MKTVNVMLTGGYGFLGRHVWRAFQRASANVWRFHHSDFDLSTHRGAMGAFNAATTHFDAVPHVVVHMAAKAGGIGITGDSPADFLFTNMGIDRNVVHLSHRYGVKRLIGVGSVCAYPKNVMMPMRELDLYNGYPEETNAAYGLGKRMLLELQTAYRRQYGLGGCHLLMANMYGPGDDFNPETSHAIPALILKTQRAKQGDEGLVVWGTGAPTRDFLYVKDAAKAIVTAARDRLWDKAEPINIGTGTDVSIGWLVSEISDIMGYSGEIVYDRSRPDGQPVRCLDTSLATSLGWEAKTALRDGLRETVEQAKKDKIL